MFKNKQAKKMKVYVVIEHAANGKDAKIHEIFTTPGPANALAESLLHGNKYHYDKNLQPVKKSHYKANGYVAVLEWSLKGPGSWVHDEVISESHRGAKWIKVK